MGHQKRLVGLGIKSRHMLFVLCLCYSQMGLNSLSPLPFNAISDIEVATNKEWSVKRAGILLNVYFKFYL